VSQSDRDIIVEALDHLAIMNEHRRRGSLDDLVILDAICFRLASAIESLSRLPGPHCHSDLARNLAASRCVRSRFLLRRNDKKFWMR
jgi:hypothetical protein